MLARPEKSDSLDRGTVPYLLTCLAAEATENPALSDHQLARFLETITAPEESLDGLDGLPEAFWGLEFPAWALDRAFRVLHEQGWVAFRGTLH
jgi:hypothetical protein